MKPYRYEDIRALPADVHARALHFGKLDGARMFIELPDDFDFQSRTGIQPASAPSPVLRGAGDVIAVIAAPIAKLVGLEGCQGCKDRQAALNEALPFHQAGRGEGGR